MAKYLFKVKLAVDGLKGLLEQGGTARRAVDLSGSASAAAMGLVVLAAGGVRTSTVVLLSRHRCRSRKRPAPAPLIAAFAPVRLVELVRRRHCGFMYIN